MTTEPRNDEALGLQALERHVRNYGAGVSQGPTVHLCRCHYGPHGDADLIIDTLTTRLREVETFLTAIEDYDTDWTMGVDENLRVVRGIARLALEALSTERTPT